jgi:hypothetical protein
MSKLCKRSSHRSSTTDGDSMMHPLTTPELELDESVPDYVNWLLKTKGLKIEKIEKSDDKIEPYNESMDITISELQETKELLVRLTNQMFNKIESLEKKKESENQKIKTKKKVQSKRLEKKKESKIVFSDLSWYREKLNSKKS